MFEDNPMLSTNVKLLKFVSVLLVRSWRMYVFLVPVGIMNALQFLNLYRIRGDANLFILSLIFAFGVFNALLRTCLIIINREKLEAFMMQFSRMYREIELSDDFYARGVLNEATVDSRKISIFNIVTAVCDLLLILLYPVFVADRVHPFGVAFPGVDMTAYPIYEIIYLLELTTPFFITVMYMPFVSLFASFAIFGKATLTILSHKLQQICRDEEHSEEQQYKELLACIKYYERIGMYVREFNSLVTYIIFVEFLLYGGMICLLLICLHVIHSWTQIVSFVLYMFTMLYVLFTYYWHANELMVESTNIAEAAYSIPWYDCSRRFKTTLLFFITVSQEPLKLMVGNVYLMSLATFQSLLNTSYSYFTILLNVYSKQKDSIN